MNKFTIGLIAFIFIGIIAGVSFYKGFQLGDKLKQADWDKAIATAAVAGVKANNKIIDDRKQVKHENQNRDRDALIRLHCERGWVFNPEQCRDYYNNGQVRNDVR